MKKRTKLIIAAPVTIVLVLVISVSSIYDKGPWRGKVVDAETGEPIEGAAVVAVWQWDYRLDPAGGHSYFLNAEETTTDENGEFAVKPAWYVSVPLVREIRGPLFTIFKPGYGSFPRYQVSPTKDLIRVFEGKSVSVKLPKLRTREERLKYMPGKPTVTIGHEDKIKHYIHLLNEENKALGLEPYNEEAQ